MNGHDEDTVDTARILLVLVWPHCGYSVRVSLAAMLGRASCLAPQSSHSHSCGGISTASRGVFGQLSRHARAVTGSLFSPDGATSAFAVISERLQTVTSRPKWSLNSII